MPTPDKIRPLVNRRCGMAPECPFESTQEWAWMRHENETGHMMEAFPLPKRIAAAPWYRTALTRDCPPSETSAITTFETQPEENR